MIRLWIVFTAAFNIQADTTESEPKKDFGEMLIPVTKGLILEHNYPDDPKQFYKNFTPHEEVAAANRNVDYYFYRYHGTVYVYSVDIPHLQ